MDKIALELQYSKQMAWFYALGEPLKYLKRFITKPLDTFNMFSSGYTKHREFDIISPEQYGALYEEAHQLAQELGVKTPLFVMSDSFRTRPICALASTNINVVEIQEEILNDMFITSGDGGATLSPEYRQMLSHEITHMAHAEEFNRGIASAALKTIGAGAIAAVAALFATAKQNPIIRMTSAVAAGGTTAVAAAPTFKTAFYKHNEALIYENEPPEHAIQTGKLNTSIAQESTNVQYKQYVDASVLSTLQSYGIDLPITQDKHIAQLQAIEKAPKHTL